MNLKISEESKEDVTNIALDTIKIGKQAIVFVNSKRSAEKTAEDISKKIKNVSRKELSDKVLAVLSSPTKQCERLAKCMDKGIAFHHSGLVGKQRELIEQNFKNGSVKIICATPTLACGIDMPAFRTIIRDLKRYSKHGMVWIPVLEYMQQAGRAGRPRYDKEGQAILIASDESQKDEFVDRYIYGEPENIYSKLAVEPVLRTYVLSLISSGFVRNERELLDFFSKTFWAHQYGDIRELNRKIVRVIEMLEDFEFIKRADFTSADEQVRITATLMGKRIAELYLDPLTAHNFIEALKKATSKHSAISFLHLVCNSIEMTPLLKIKAKEYEEINGVFLKQENLMLVKEPSMYDSEYDYYMNAFKTALMLNSWIDEVSEEELMQKYDVRPGELHVKLEIANWLLYSCQEISRIAKFQGLITELTKLRIRVNYGVKEELLILLKLRNIGRVRARKLYINKIKTISDVRSADIGLLSRILGLKIAQDVKDQVTGKKDGSDIDDNLDVSLKKFSN